MRVIGDKKLVDRWEKKFEKWAKKTHTTTKDLVVRVYKRRGKKAFSGYVKGNFHPLVFTGKTEISLGIPLYPNPYEVEGIFLHELGHYHQFKYYPNTYYGISIAEKQFYADKFAYKFCPKFPPGRGYSKYQKWVIEKERGKRREN